MAISSLCLARLRSAYILLNLLPILVVLPSYAYTPPATPNLPLSFEFLGSNAEAESIAFYNTQCDSNNYSWYGTDWFCAVGDPSNPVCYVKMAYHSTDLNNCTNPIPEPLPQLPVGTDAYQNGTGSSQNMASLIKAISEANWTQLSEANSLSRDILTANKHSNNLTSQILQTMNRTGDRAIVDAINSWGSTNHLEMRSQFEQDNHYKVREEQRAKELNESFNKPWDYQGGMVQDIDAIAFYTDANNSRLNWLADWVIPNVATVINNSASSDSSLERSLLIQIEDAIYSLADTGNGTPSDNTAIVDQLVESNNSLSDITLRMRDIENAIGKSEKSIVDALDGIEGGSPDSADSVGCASFTCSANTSQCYIARKQWESSCAIIADNKSNQETATSLKNQLSDFVGSPDSDIQNIDAGTVDTTKFMNKYTNSNGVNFGGADSCPPPYVVDAGITSFTLDLQPFCDLAGVIRFLLIAFATVAAGLMVVKYF
ncbi:virulence factor TspB C-terminal domain-related protein [Shewanella oncorhynchi]|uniref:virulence factor TspB C-terminal domain-related protein n=1 Tax=Shewanella oncorhynchi TaxID=2726434 RepID=UPI003D79C213